MDPITYSIYQSPQEVEDKIKDRSVLLIDNEAQRQILTMEDCIEAFEDAFREEGLGAAINRTKSAIYIPTSDPKAWHHYVSMEGGVRKLGVVGLRIRSHIHAQRTIFGKLRHDYYTVTPGNFGGMVFLFSSEDGSLLAILNDGHIQHMRVAVTNALSAKYMAREDAQVLGILGSGGLSTTHAWALSKVRSLKKIKVYSPDPEHRERFAQQLKSQLGLEVVVFEEAEKVVRGSDIICCCTNSNQPVLKGSWLESGMHITFVTPFELGNDALDRVNRYTLYRDAVAQHHFTTPEDWRPPNLGGTTAQVVENENKLFGPENIASLPQILLGQAVGRANKNEITAFTSEGTGVQFATIASRAYQGAKRMGLGRELPLSWFCQSIKS